MKKPVLFRITTVPVSLKILLKGQLHFMQQNGFEVVALSAEGDDVKFVVESEGVKHITLPLTRTISPIADIRALLTLIFIIKRLKPTIVHTHTPKAGLIGMIAAYLCNVPVRLHTVAGLPLMEATGLKHAVLRYTEKITYRCSHLILPNSVGLSEFLVKSLGFSPSKVKILGKGSSNGIDTSYFSRTEEVEATAKGIRTRYGIRDDDVVFSFVGRVVRDKGIVELVTAFRLLRGKNQLAGGRRMFLLIVGSFEHDLDPLPVDIQHFMNSDPEIILAGFQSDVRPWIVASDIFTFPSYREGFPNVVMQASLLKVPSIVSDINGCNEIIRDNDTGLIVPPKNILALKNAMSVMMYDVEKRRIFASRAYEFVLKNFDHYYIWTEMLSLYRTLLAKKLKC